MCRNCQFGEIGFVLVLEDSRRSKCSRIPLHTNSMLVAECVSISSSTHKFRPHYLAPLKELCNRKFKSRFIAELEGNGSARAVGHQERVLVESLEVLNHDLLQMRGIVCGWE